MIAELEEFDFIRDENELKSFSFSKLFFLLEKQLEENDGWNKGAVEGRSPSDPPRITTKNNQALSSISRFLSEAYEKAANNELVFCFEKFMQARIVLERNIRYFDVLSCSHMEDAALGSLLRAIIKKFSGLWLDCAEKQFKLSGVKFLIENERDITLLDEV